VTAPEASMFNTMPGSVGELEFRNVGKATCALEGWPGVAVERSGEGAGWVKVLYGYANGSWVVERTRVVLRPRAVAAASVLIAGSSVGSCDAPWTWSVSVPGSTRVVTVSETANPNGPCPGATIEVSPVHPGGIPLVGTYPPHLRKPPPGGLFSSPPGA